MVCLNPMVCFHFKRFEGITNSLLFINIVITSIPYVSQTMILFQTVANNRKSDC